MTIISENTIVWLHEGFLRISDFGSSVLELKKYGSSAQRICDLNWKFSAHIYINMFLWENSKRNGKSCREMLKISLGVPRYHKKSLIIFPFVADIWSTDYFFKLSNSCRPRWMFANVIISYILNYSRENSKL